MFVAASMKLGISGQLVYRGFGRSGPEVLQERCWGIADCRRRPSRGQGAWAIWGVAMALGPAGL